jgi:hypothetical protein
VEFGNSFHSVCQVLGGFPGVFAFAVAFPADKVLELTAVNTTVNDRIDFVFFFALNDYRFRQGWCRGCALFFAFLCLFLASASCHSATHMVVTWTPC